jgi:large subunit ribosomal protein L9e
MRLVYAHFPINAIISKDKRQIEIKNFLGGKRSHTVNLNPGCTVYLDKEVKDQLIFDGIDNAALSQSCS